MRNHTYGSELIQEIQSIITDLRADFPSLDWEIIIQQLRRIINDLQLYPEATNPTKSALVMIASVIPYSFPEREIVEIESYLLNKFPDIHVNLDAEKKNFNGQLEQKVEKYLLEQQEKSKTKW